MFDERFFRPFERLPEGEDGLEVLSLDVAEMDKNLIVKARLPGLRPEEVDISISGNVLTIKGESREETGEEVGLIFAGAAGSPGRRSDGDRPEPS